jgi:hypothetical protein
MLTEGLRPKTRKSIPGVWLATLKLAAPPAHHISYRAVLPAIDFTIAAKVWDI